MLWAACGLGSMGRRIHLFKVRCYRSLLSPSDIPLTLARIHKLFTYVRHSKTDPFGQGCHINFTCLGCTDTSLCPVTAILGYLSVRPSKDRPLFLFHNGVPLTRLTLILCHISEGGDRLQHASTQATVVKLVLPQQQHKLAHLGQVEVGSFFVLYTDIVHLQI